MNPEQVDQIQDVAASRIHELLMLLGIEFQNEHGFLTAPCPIHGGDNPRGWFWAFRSQSWKCNTAGCHTLPCTGPSTSLFGLVRGIMSVRTDRQWTFPETIEYVCQLLGMSDNPEPESSAEDRLIAKTVIEARQRMREKRVANSVLLSDYLDRMQPDRFYYPSRGYLAETLERYHVSYCGLRDKPFFERAFFPVLDMTGVYAVGWSGRSIWERCDRCRQYHNPRVLNCPAHHPRWAKWRHSAGFRVEDHLYNLWNSGPHIEATQTAILVEGPGDVWALEEAGIRNSVAIMGLNLSSRQNRLLQKSGALTLVLLCDRDASGEKGSKRLSEALSMYFRVVVHSLTDGKDAGDMDRQTLRDELGSFIDLEERA